MRKETWVSEKEIVPKGAILNHPYFIYQGVLLTEGQVKQNGKATREAVLIPAGTPLPEDVTRIRKYRESTGNRQRVAAQPPPADAQLPPDPPSCEPLCKREFIYRPLARGYPM